MVPVPVAPIRIIQASPSDLHHVLSVERAAFGQDDEAELVRALLEDPSAQPLLSLLAWVEGRPVGHILFTAARIGDRSAPVRAAILAPLAVVPEAQRRGVGGGLISHGLGLLGEAGLGLVLVAGHPDYYPRQGFEPAMPHGLLPPIPIPDEHADAWMVRALREGILGAVRGRVVCADAMNRPEYWRE